MFHPVTTSTNDPAPAVVDRITTAATTDPTAAISTLIVLAALLVTAAIALIIYGASGTMPEVTLVAGQQASGIVVFEVPTSVGGGVATFGDGTVFEAVQ